MLHMDSYKKTLGSRNKRCFVFLGCVLLLMIMLLITSDNKLMDQDSDKVIGITCPIEGLQFGMTLEECKQNLSEFIFMPVEDLYMTYLLSDKMKVLGYKAEVLLFFIAKYEYEWIPFQSDGLYEVQFNYEDVNIDQIKKNISTLIGTQSEDRIDINKDIVTTWKSKDTVSSLDKQKQNILYDYWNLLEENSSNEFIRYQKEDTEPISYISLRNTGNNNCSVRFSSNMLYLLEKLGAMN